MGNNRITETGPGLVEEAALQIDLIEHMEERSAGSMDLIREGRVLAGSMASVEHAKVGWVCQL